MKHLLAFIILSFILNAGQGQERLTLKTSNVVLKNKQLNTLFKDYKIVNIDLSLKKVRQLKSLNLLPVEIQNGAEIVKIDYERFEISNIDDNNYPITYSNDNNLSLTINENFINGYVQLENKVFFIQPLQDFIEGANQEEYVLYLPEDVIDTKARTCGVVNSLNKAKDIQTKVNTLGCEIIDLAIANDYSMFAEYGSIINVTNHNVAVINNVRTLYRSEFDYNIEFRIVNHFIPTSNAQDPFTSSTDPGDLLNDFISWASINGNPWSSLNHDMGELWTNRDFDGFTIGLAQTPFPNNPYSEIYHVLENTSSNASILRNLTAHEMGHNFSAIHDGANTPFIMAPSINLTTSWSTSSINNISTRLATIKNSLSNCSSIGAPIASLIMPASGCTNIPITIKDNSENGESRTWSTTGGNLSSNSDSQPTITFASTGTYTITLNSSNNGGNDITSKSIQIIDEPTPDCTPTGNGGNGGLLSLTINNMSNSSDNTQNAGVYENFFCSHSITIEPSTSYEIAYETEFHQSCRSQSQLLAIFIDYNNDNDFSDSGELVASSNFAWCGGPISSSNDSGLSFTTPSTLIGNTLFRVRAIVSNTQINNACQAISYGQAEDYSAIYNLSGVEGCTDPNSCNYNASATVDDGSCDYSCFGCTDNTACNYDSGATMDDGSCDFSCYGCTNMMACNYDNTATLDDGSCEFSSCVGCMTDGSHNYDPTATMPATCETCTDNILNGDEVQIDCGGSLCDACPCTFAGNVVFNNQTLNSDNTTITSGNVISTNNTVTIQGNNTDVIWQSTQSIQLNPNFTINSGTLLINVEDCEEP